MRSGCLARQSNLKNTTLGKSQCNFKLAPSTIIRQTKQNYYGGKFEFGMLGDREANWNFPHPNRYQNHLLGLDFLMIIEDFDILSILGDSISAASYKVQHKSSKEFFVLRTLDYENLNDTEKNILLTQISSRKNLKHPILLQFIDTIDQRDSNLFYLVTNFCPNGSLRKFLDCLEKDSRLSEELLCKILYQLVSAAKVLKIFAENLLALDEIFLDENYNVKLFYFGEASKDEAKMCDLGALMYELCTLKKFDKNSYERELSAANYSSSMVSILTHMIQDTNNLNKNINKILRHPTVILKSSQWTNENCFTSTKTAQIKIVPDDEKLNLEKLRNYQTILKQREQKLIENEHRLHKREKKVALMERMVTEKITQADLYLKRCRESKSTSSGASSNSKESIKKKVSYEQLDTSLSACDSFIQPTSAKLNLNKIAKPGIFTRTMSERRIRFKGHSPLKDIHNAKVHHKRKTVKKVVEEEVASDKGSEKSNGTKLFAEDENIYENDCVLKSKVCRPISWTEENKKQAFDLLRIMNGTVDKENCDSNVKHTYL